jgi:hypothetical protein
MVFIKNLSIPGINSESGMIHNKCIKFIDRYLIVFYDNGH